MSVIDNVKVGAHARGRHNPLTDALTLPSTRSEERQFDATAHAMLAFVGLEATAERPAASLSLGARKRVELARALAGEPTLLLLDEPAGGLNHEEVSELGGLIRAIRDRLGITVLLVEHHMGLVMSLSRIERIRLPSSPTSSWLRPPAGSSSNSSSGCAASARASSTRLRSTSVRLAAGRPARCSSPTKASMARAVPSSSLLTPRRGERQRIGQRTVAAARVGADLDVVEDRHRGEQGRGLEGAADAERGDVRRCAGRSDCPFRRMSPRACR